MAIKGAILGDIIGSQYEFKRPSGFNYKTAPLLTDKSSFTDDTVLTLATKYAIENDLPFDTAYHYFGNKYYNVGYGESFMDWLSLNEYERKPYGSYGNGSAMRVSYIGEYYRKLEDVMVKARESAECTHNHPEGIKGAEFIAKCVWLARHDATKKDILELAIKEYPKDKYIYSPANPLSEMTLIYRWDVTCQGSVPAVIRCLYEANNYTEFIRNVYSLPCDTDTLCAIGGGIAEELFDNRDDEIMSKVDEILSEYLDDYLLKVLNTR